MREQARFLEYVTDGAGMRRQKKSTCLVLPTFTVDRKPAGRRARQTGDAAQQAGLTAARWTEQRRDSLARCAKRCIQRKVAERQTQICLDAVHARGSSRRLMTY